MRASFGSGPLIFSPRGLGFDVKISRSGGEGICPFLEIPSHVSGSYEIESTL